MAKLLSVLGAFAPGGARVAPAGKPSEINEVVDRLRASGALVKVRFRAPSEMSTMPVRIRSKCAALLAQAESGSVRVVVSRRPDPLNFNRLISSVVELKTTEPQMIPVDLAVRVLSGDPYMYLFEEVDQSPSALPAAPLEGPPRAGEVSQLRSMEQALAAERDARAALEAQMSEMRSMLAALSSAKDDESDDHDTDDTPKAPRAGKRR